MKLFKKKSQEITKQSNANIKDDIAIIGMACRFPGASNYQQYWQNLVNGINSIQEIPSSRWDVAKYYSTKMDDINSSVSKWGGFLDDIETFDAEFFNISQREAMSMDPQQRILLQEAWHCIEDAGILLTTLQQHCTSVYVGVMAVDYQHTLASALQIDNYACIGTYESIIANRLSYCLGLSGESKTVNTACSSSLVAMHDASRGLLCGDYQYAFAAGVNIICNPMKYISFSKSRMLSPDGQCKTFDKDANGYVPGEGVGIVLLTTMQRALSYGYRIHGVLKGSAINHTAKSRSITAPSVNAQREVILAAQKIARINPESITYIEAHGTGTPLGDPIEIESLTQAFQEGTQKLQYCAVGSVKTNIGHLESAAGIAGVIKVILMMQHQKLVATLNVQVINTLINFEKSPFYLVQQSQDWLIEQDTKRYAGVSSFGFGGVNAHVILEEYIPLAVLDDKSLESTSYPFILSSKSAEGLQALIKLWQEYVDTSAFHQKKLHQISYTLLQKREMHSYRLAFAVSSQLDLVQQLSTLAHFDNKIKAPIVSIFIASSIDISADEVNALLQQHPLLKIFYDHCCHLLNLKKRQSILKKWQHHRAEKGRPLFEGVLLYCFSMYLKKLGLNPHVIGGCGIGQVVAAAVSEYLTLDEALQILVRWEKSSHDKKTISLSTQVPRLPFYDGTRDIIIDPLIINRVTCQQLRKCLMLDRQLLINLKNQAQLLKQNQFTFQQYLEEWNKAIQQELCITLDDLWAYDDNTKEESEIAPLLLLQIILLTSLEKLQARWQLSPRFEIQTPELTALVKLLVSGQLSYKIIIAWIQCTDDSECQRFAMAVKTLAQSGFKLEVAELFQSVMHTQPTPALSLSDSLVSIDNAMCQFNNACREYFSAEDHLTVLIGSSVDSCASVQIDNPQSLLTSLLTLWTKGLINEGLRNLYPHKGQIISLPLYPFLKVRHWISAESSVQHRLHHNELFGQIDRGTSTLDKYVVKTKLKKNDFYLSDHIVQGHSVLPGVVYLEMAKKAAELASPTKKVQQLRDIAWMSPLIVKELTQDAVTTLISAQDWIGYEISTGDIDSHVVHGQGKICYGEPQQPVPMWPSFNEVNINFTLKLTSRKLYQQLAKIGLCYGHGFQSLLWVKIKTDEGLGCYRLPSVLKTEDNTYALHPSVIDSALQTALCILNNTENRQSQLMMPFAMASITLYQAIPLNGFIIVRSTPSSNITAPSYDVQICNENNGVCAVIENLVFRSVKNEISPSGYAKTTYKMPVWVSEPISQLINTQLNSLIVMTDDMKLMNALREMLIDTLIIQIKLGDHYQKLDNKTYQLRLNEQQDYEQFFAAINNDGYKISYFVLARDMNQCHNEQKEHLENTINNEFHIKVIFLQALLHQFISKPMFIISLYSYAFERFMPETMFTGFIKSLHHEHPQCHIRVLGLDDSLTVNVIPELIKAEFLLPSPTALHCRYVARERQALQYETVETQKLAALPWREQGVYLIIGGLGEIGFFIAEYLAKKYQAKLILTGRSPLTENKQTKLNLLSQQDAKVIYLQGDVADSLTVLQWLQTGKKQFGTLNGIIHCAGVLQDSLFINKKWTTFTKVMAPKILGAWHLDELTQAEPLDCFILFSSLSSCLGNVGQTDYATANAFLDYFAEWREGQVQLGKRFGKSAAINWPLWLEGGMGIESHVRDHLQQSWGTHPLPTELGLKALTWCLQQAHSQCLVLYGNPTSINHQLDKFNKCTMQIIQDQISTQTQDISNSEALVRQTVHYLKAIMADNLLLPVNKLADDIPLVRYGLDSILIIETTEMLENDFGVLPKTLFFEYHTLLELAHYFIEHYANILENKFSMSERGDDRHEISSAESIKDSNTTHKLTSNNTRQYREEDVAIIGINGRYPMAISLDEFWENLKTGKDCVTEIPLTRWDYRPFYDVDKQKSGKSYSKWGAFIENIDKFDPLFFNISPHEAQLIDPQERLFLEVAWQTFEDANYLPHEISQQYLVGVFVGVMFAHYQLYGLEEAMKGNYQNTDSLLASIANRVSYSLNLQGPSMAVDTMCSSSLTAVHLACESIRRGECQLALAGGVNIASHPAKYQYLSHRKFLSSRGKCESFGAAGDGYVPGEGVGAVLLKPLKQAINDGDRIAGIIKGSSLNHGGQTTGYTVPDPTAQATLIQSALKQSGIGADSISYIEAHGTGTSLGDPIEVRGLTLAFGDTIKKSCPIGSVKSNIGHLEAAAGIASLTKVLLQLKNKQLVPSIHSTTLNPNIVFDATPFYVQQSLCKWESKDDHPLLAGISSFGAGGSNAHLIIEEAPTLDLAQHQTKPYYLIAFSAKHPDSLRQRMIDLSTFLKIHEELVLEAIAYTLNARRTHFNYRATLVVSSIDELKNLLVAIEQGKHPSQYLLSNKIAFDEQQPTFKELLDKLIQDLSDNQSNAVIYEQKLQAIADLYIKGYQVDWTRLHSGEAMQSISLPTYPFLKKRCWVDIVNATTSTSHNLHPLLGYNDSTLHAQCYKTKLNSHAFYLTDHVIANQSILPGVCYLEMARAAGQLANRSSAIVGFRNIIWVKPVIMITDSIELSLYVSLNDQKTKFKLISFENEIEVLHSQGEIEYGKIKEPTIVNIKKIEQSLIKSLANDSIYQLLQDKGFFYGPCFQSLQWIKFNNEKALGYLVLADNLKHSFDRQEYNLHPSLLDGALHSIVVLEYTKTDDNTDVTLVPFTIDEIKLYKSLPDQCFVVVERSQQKYRYNIQIYNLLGETLIILNGFTVRPFIDNSHALQQLGLYSLHWQSMPISSQTAPELTTGVLVIGSCQELIESLKAQLSCEIWQTSASMEAEQYEQLIAQSSPKITHIIFLASLDSFTLPLSEDSRLDVSTLFVITRAFFKNKRHKRINLHYIAPSIPSPQMMMVTGFFKTVRLENPNFRYCVILLSEVIGSKGWIEKVIAQLSLVDTGVEMTKYHEDKLITRSLLPIDYSTLNKIALPLKIGGVYLITGGLGGLGYIFACYLAEQYKAKLVLTGRSILSDDKVKLLKNLAELGGSAIYLEGDISDPDNASSIIAKAKECFGYLQGVIHSAGLINDSLILTKKLNEFHRILLPKVSGTILLDLVTQHEPLDFMVFFSSIVSIMGNIGQSDYASANAFLDEFAVWRNQLVEQGLRSGNSISINWPYWQAGGMKMQPESIAAFANDCGLMPLTNEVGIKAFEYALKLQQGQVLVAHGNLEKFNKQQTMMRKQDSQAIPKLIKANNHSTENLKKIEQQFLLMCSEVLKVESLELELNTELSEYGLDSILMMTLLNEVEETFGLPVNANALIDYPTIADFAYYLVEERAVALPSLEQMSIPDTPIINNNERVRFNDDKISTGSSKIAIIGMAGKFPGSPDLIHFWDNLSNGINLITEVPASRWSLSHHYHPDVTIPHKSYSKWGGFMTEIEYFAAEYFGIKAEDAIIMDPPQRILLELTQTLIDSAGYTKTELSGSRTGVYLGGSESHYRHFYPNSINDASLKHRLVNRIQNMQAARISDFYNLTGPSYTIDTACSSSLVAIHQACQSLLADECQLAIAGGAEVLIGPEYHIDFSKAEVLAKNDKSYVFDERANGFVLGEGAGLVLLKSLEKAMQDGDRILGVILSSAINNDGNTIGLTVPSLKGQQEVIQTALDKSGISPASISYYEAHGTGTLLGDPIELKAMNAVYQQYTNDIGYCAVGSVKSNMGHALHAAGIASMIKTLLCLQHRTLVPTLNCDKPHPRFQFEKSAFYPIKDKKEWQLHNNTRRAAISSFGFGGTNCHLILEEAPVNYQEIRKVLPATLLIKKRYWLGDDNTFSFKEDDEYYLTLLNQLKSGLISEAQILEKLDIE